MAQHDLENFKREAGTLLTRSNREFRTRGDACSACNNGTESDTVQIDRFVPLKNLERMHSDNAYIAAMKSSSSSKRMHPVNTVVHDGL